MEKAIAEAVRNVVRERRPTAIATSGRTVPILQQPDDEEAPQQHAAEKKQTGQQTKRRASEQISEAIVRRSNKVMRLTNFEGCAAVVS